MMVRGRSMVWILHGNFWALMLALVAMYKKRQKKGVKEAKAKTPKFISFFLKETKKKKKKL